MAYDPQRRVFWYTDLVIKFRIFVFVVKWALFAGFMILIFSIARDPKYQAEVAAKQAQQEQAIEQWQKNQPGRRSTYDYPPNGSPQQDEPQQDEPQQDEQQELAPATYDHYTQP